MGSEEHVHAGDHGLHMGPRRRRTYPVGYGAGWAASAGACRPTTAAAQACAADVAAARTAWTVGVYKHGDDVSDKKKGPRRVRGSLKGSLFLRHR